MPLEWQKTVEHLFLFAITGGVGSVVGLLWNLNRQVAVIVERMANQKEALDDHEERISNLEYRLPARKQH